MFRARCINLTKLSESPEADQIVRLMWGINDLNGIAHLGAMQEECERNRPELWKLLEGIQASLTRMRSAQVTEILETIVQPLVMNESQQRFPELDSIIKTDEPLAKLRKQLRTLFCGPEREQFDQHRQIRHNLVSHYNHEVDSPIITDALRMAASELADENGQATSWCMFREDNNQYESRYILADEVLTRAWRTPILNVPYNESGYKESPEAQRSLEFTLKFMQLFLSFAARLIMVYCDKHQLWLDEDHTQLFTPPESRTTGKTS